MGIRVEDLYKQLIENHADWCGVRCNSAACTVEPRVDLSVIQRQEREEMSPLENKLEKEQITTHLVK